MKLNPLGDRVIVEASTPQEKSAGGIIIPDNAKEKPMSGIVVAAGKGRILENGNRIDMEVGVGDKVIFGKFSGTEIEIENKTYLIMREGDIFGIL